MQHATKEGASEGVWSIVLAGGEGERIKPLIEQWLGYDRPKQYCTFVGTRSLLQHTLDRADSLTSPERRIVVVASHHDKYVWEQLRGRGEGHVLFQPRNCGTAPGILLPLAYVLARDPDARVVIYPSDHFVQPEERFTRLVAEALIASEASARTVLLGVKPDQDDGDYGWIRPGAEIMHVSGRTVWGIERFIEKPGSDAIRTAPDALWNTFVLVGSVRSLWALGWRYLPELMPRFEELRREVGRPAERAVVERIYQDMPERDFSAGVLERGAEHLALMDLDGVRWSDWGRPERVLQTLERLGIGAPFAVA